MNLIRTKTS